MNRKQTAFKIIDNQVSTYVFDSDCEGKSVSKSEACEKIYKFLLSGHRAQHFKFLTADWIKQTIIKCLEDACKYWCVHIVE